MSDDELVKGRKNTQRIERLERTVNGLKLEVEQLIQLQAIQRDRVNKMLKRVQDGLELL